MIKFVPFLFVTFLSSLSFSQSKPERDDTNEFKVEILNYQSDKSIQKFKKLEIGIVLNEEIHQRILGFIEPDIFPHKNPINPFLDWELDIDVVFEHPASGYIKSRDFFYYKEFTRDTIHDDWTDEQSFENKHMMRARFAPTVSGEWNTKITIKVKGELIKEFASISFFVEENEHPGFVSVHENKRNFERGGKIIYPMGHVFPGPYNGVKVWGTDHQKTNKAAGVKAWMAYHKDVTNYAAQGGKFIKTCETAYGNLLEFEHKGNYYNRMHYAWEQDKLLDLCEEKDILIYYNLLFQDVFMTYGQSGSGNKYDAGGFEPVPWDYGNYGPDGKVNYADYFPTYGYFVEGKQPSFMFLDKTSMDYHKQRTRYYIARYGYSPQIYMWELLSEPWHLDQYHGHIPGEEINGEGNEIVIKALDNYNNEVSNYIKEELNQKEQLISICQFNISDVFVPELFYYSLRNKNIDVVGFNLYGDGTNKLLGRKRKSNAFEVGEEERSLYKQAKWIHDEFGKPLILSEAGHYNYLCSNSTGNYVDVMTMGYTGVAGVTIWNGYIDNSHSSTDSRLMWNSTIAASKVLNDSLNIRTLQNGNGEWKQGRQEEKVKLWDNQYSKELEYFTSKDGKTAVGYIKNRTYNVHTTRINDDCMMYNENQSPFNELMDIDWKKGMNDLEVEGLNGKMEYKVHWLDFKSGKLIGTEIHSTNRSGTMRLKFPELKVTEEIVRPIIWFEIEQADEK